MRIKNVHYYYYYYYLFIFHLFTFLTFALQSLSGHCRLPRYRQPLEKLLNPSSVVFPN